MPSSPIASANPARWDSGSARGQVAGAHPAALVERGVGRRGKQRDSRDPEPAAVADHDVVADPDAERVGRVGSQGHLTRPRPTPLEQHELGRPLDVVDRVERNRDVVDRNREARQTGHRVDAGDVGDQRRRVAHDVTGLLAIGLDVPDGTEPLGVLGGVGNAGGEGQAPDHAEDADDRAGQRRTGRERPLAAAGVERQADTGRDRHGRAPAQHPRCDPGPGDGGVVHRRVRGAPRRPCHRRAEHQRDQRRATRDDRQVDVPADIGIDLATEADRKARDATTAVTAAATAATATETTCGSANAAARSRRENPSAASVGTSSPEARTERVSACPMITSAATTTASANSRRPDRSRSVPFVTRFPAAARS